MSNKLIRFLILVFWVLMLVLLVGRDILPGGAGSVVPVETVIRHVFDGGQRSQLGIHRDGVRVGDVDLTVARRDKKPMILVEGAITLNMDGKLKRWQFGAKLVCDDADEIKLEEGAVWARMGRTEVDGAFAFNLPRDYYHLSFGGAGFERQILDGTALAIREQVTVLLDQWTGGAYTNVLGHIVAKAVNTRHSQSQAPMLVATKIRESLGGQPTDCFEVRLMTGDEAQIRVLMTVLGEILTVETLSEFRLVSEAEVGVLP